MENHKVYLSNGQTFDVSCDDCKFNQNTNSFDFYFNNEVGFSVNPHYVSVTKVVKEPKLAPGFIINKK